jgi:N-acetylmuramoyl-L-alanine amidase
MARLTRAERLDRRRALRKRLLAVGGAAAVVLIALGVGVVLFIGGPDTEAEDATLADLTPLLAAAESTATSTSASAAVLVEVPDFAGMPIEEAELLLEAAGLHLVKLPTPPGDAAEGTVLEQLPAAGERVPEGSEVQLVYADSAATTPAVLAYTTGSAPGSGYVVCLDPGHQAAANMEQEPIGPGASETKPKVTGGATGVVTGQAEHELVLALAFEVKERLEGYGITVVMARTAANVDISNAARAQVANDAGADLFVRIHAASSTNAALRGISTLRPGGNEWVAPIEDESLRAATALHAALVAATGAEDRGIHPHADLAGFNYATVPSVLTEVGFLSNPLEDEQLAEAAYRARVAEGITRGVLAYLDITR